MPGATPRETMLDEKTVEQIILHDFIGETSIPIDIFLSRRGLNG